MAVTNRTECFFFSIRQIQGIILFLVVVGNRFAHSNPRGCDIVRNDLLAKGLQINAVLERPSLGPVCGADSCCGKDELFIKQHNHMLIDQYLKESINRIASLIENRARKFDEFFREMMTNSKREFHEMFEKTYGKIYLQNADVFGDFFKELETYYKKGSVRLSETMDSFFGILYQRMFIVINGQYDFEEKYLECVAEHMSEMKPFGDIPHKLGIQLRRSFVATRTFYKSLLQGSIVARKMGGLRVDEECAKDITKMQQCGICTGQQTVGTCADFCTITLENCLRYHMMFSKDWDKYIDGLDKVADRLLGPFNIEIVVEPLNIKISEAIMNFQESGTEISKKIYGMCGQPKLNRRKRKAEYENPAEDNPNFEIKYEPIKTLGGGGGGGGKRKNKKAGKVDNTPTLEKLINEIKSKIKETRQFWIQLPYQYCNNETVASPPSSNGNCWNGTAIGNFEKPTTKIGKLQSPIVNEQNFTIQVYTDKLRKAYQGEEVELIDDSEEPLAGSGSGSGDGAGRLDVEEETDSPIKPNPNGDIVPVDSVPPVEVVPPTTTSRKPEVVRSGNSGSNNNVMSLAQALIQFSMPLVLVWFGGTLSELL